MTPNMLSGFSDELEKTAKYKAITKVMKKLKGTKIGKSEVGKQVRGAAARFQRSPEYRAAVGRGAALGAATGGAAGVTGGGDDSAIERFLRGAAGGAAAGALTGASRPGWFGRKSGVAEGEKITRLGSKARKRT